MDRRNMPSGQVAVLMSPEQLAFIIRNCESNETFAVNQLLAWSQLSPEAFTEDLKESFFKLDALKNEFRELRLHLQGQAE